MQMDSILLEIGDISDQLHEIDVTDYLLTEINPKISLEHFIQLNLQLGKLYEKILMIDQTNFVKYCNLLIQSYIIVLRVDFENEIAHRELVIMYSQLCEHSIRTNNLEQALVYLKTSLSINPIDYSVHANLGFIYKNLNKIDESLIHYKISLALNKTDINTIANCLNGISCVYRSIQKWPESLFYLLRAVKLLPQDPDILNGLGIVYTEMRRTDLAEINYLKAIENYTKTTIYKNNPKILLEDLNLNLGHMYSFNGDDTKSIEQYNRVLKLNPRHRYAFQNKLMNLVYLFDRFEDKKYIYQQHLLIDRIFPRTIPPKNNFINKKTRIGVISGDFINHPVSYFITAFLQNYDTSKFEVYCYSECIINTQLLNKNIIFQLIRGKNTEQVCNMLKYDRINILLDLSGHTSHNRIDVFAKKPIDIQVSYIGYPYTSGLKTMDYRITDAICDNNIISQEYYTEKLINLKNCFLCYDPLLHKIPEILERKATSRFRIGCFNRLNKITDVYINMVNQILRDNPEIEFVFKTKAFTNHQIKYEFINKFDKSIHNRIIFLDCAILHLGHLEQYNEINISIDTFPYSGTTTTCESLLMGVPVISLYDSKFYFHAQNVSCSILKNSGMDEYICNTIIQIREKVKSISNTTIDKRNIRHKFQTGKVCDKNEYIKNISELFNKLT
jgi:protein O-GlcNAc transferase